LFCWKARIAGYYTASRSRRQKVTG
jgi:hypothetical protein